MNEELTPDQGSVVRKHSRGRRWFDSHGSWLLLLAVAIASWMAGSQHNAASTASTVQILTDFYQKQEDNRVKRIRELLDINQRLALQLGTKADVAIGKAEQAVSKAAEAADKATQAVDASKAP